MNVERQLAEPLRCNQDGSEMSTMQYKRWRSRAHSSLVYKKGEQTYLKDWMKQRRVDIEAGKAGVFDVHDPRAYLVRARAVLKLVLDGDTTAVGQAYSAIDQFLQNEG